MLKLNLASPKLAEMAALAGVDAIWLDREHGGADWTTAYHSILAASRHQTATVVRVAKGSYSDMVQPLELGATAVMVPQVSSVEEAERIVRHTKFHPLGRRPVDDGHSDSGYGQWPITDYMDTANRATLTIVQIENPEGAAAVEEIAAIDGVDALFLGPSDLCHSVGAPGRFDHPVVRRTQHAIAQACERAGKIAASVAHPGTTVAELIDQGYRLINVGGDVRAIRQGFNTYLSQAHNAHHGRHERASAL